VVRGHQVTWTSSQQKQHDFSVSSPTASRGALHNWLVSTPAPRRSERGRATCHTMDGRGGRTPVGLDGAGSATERVLLYSWFGALFDLLQRIWIKASGWLFCY